MEKQKQKKVTEKRPPDKKNKPKYVAKDSIEGQNQIKKVQSNEPNYQNKRPYQHTKNQHKPKKQFIERQLAIKRQSSYESALHCLICSEGIRKKDPIWTCRQCCISLHLRCIKQWIHKSNPETEKKKLFIYNWPCIQCKTEYNEPIPDYYCFCGKFKNPEFDRDLEPHSCGQLCERKRGINCPHLCPRICHNGKCNPCEVQGAKATCYCGKTERSTKCSEDKPQFQCGKKCQKLLNCGKHKCERNCHQGECFPCKKKKMATCYCEKNQDIIDCAQKSYGCAQQCGKLLNCRYHKCEKDCHQGLCGQCQKTPEIQTTCHCGRYSLMMISQIQRQSCKDPIPSCGMPCNKTLLCGHKCSAMCHEGKCSQCKVQVIQKCSCRSIQRKIQCFKAIATKDQFKCETLCKKRRACGQHNCNVVCCPSKNSPYPEEHPCQLTCQRILNCQKHTCDMPCHAGLCKKCPVIYSQPQPCPCGATSLKPPVVCGTLTPECDSPCNKMMQCGHKCLQICHYGECRCLQEVEVTCRCGLSKIKTICGKQALCLNKCQKELKCGHKCLVQCHPGKCSDWIKGSSCSKKCDKIRPDCGHRCKMICHAGKNCEDFTCQAEILIKCQCGHRQKQVLCQSKGLNDKGNKIVKQIVCNEKCENLKRFDILYKGKQIYYPNGLIQFGFKNWNYLQKIEERLKKFILESEEKFIEIDFKLDNLSRVALLNLFENHYHLNTHYYRHMKGASFTLMQGEDTMIPNPILTQYIKKVTKGQIKRTNLPFEYTIKFDSQPKERTDGIIRLLKPFIHKYYIERKDKMALVHFWSKQQALKALNVLQSGYINVDFKGEQNQIDRQNVEELQEEIPIGDDQIVETEVKRQIKNEEEQKNVTSTPTQKQESNEAIALMTEQNIKGQPQKAEESKNKEKIIMTTKVIKKPPIIIRPPNPFMVMREYPPSSEFVQDIYEIDGDELFGDTIDWDKDIIEKFLPMKLGIEASEWRIRVFIILSLFHPIKESILNEEFSRIHNMYEKDKKKAQRILQIQKIEAKKVQQEMEENHIYLSDHQPEILSYCLLHNYLALDKVQVIPSEQCSQTREVQKVLEIIEEVEQLNLAQFYSSFQSADYVLACMMKPLVKVMRTSFVKQLIKMKKFAVEGVVNNLLFECEEQFMQFCNDNGVSVYKKFSKSEKSEFYRIKEEYQLGTELNVEKYEKSIIQRINEKRNKKYFLSEAEELVENKWMTRSFFAFGDFKENVTKQYVQNLAKQLKNAD